MDEAKRVNRRILLVDSDHAFAAVLQDVVGEGFNISHVDSVKEAIPLLRSDKAEVALLNWDQPEQSDHTECMALLNEAQDLPVPLPVIVFSWDKRRECAIQALKGGAWDFFPQPLDILALKFALDRAHSRFLLAKDLADARKLISVQRIDGLIGNSKPMERVYEVMRKVAGVSTTVLITGESGTGKEVVARAIHRLSPRAQKPFVAFSACALPESLIEDELFGHGKGAFTGASQSRRGRFEEAQGGTIFLDEIGDLGLPLQAKLLRVLQERSVERLGSNAPIPLDVRVICATNRDLDQMVKDGTFRQDLYFRISVVKIQLPPLRERAEDVPILAEYFLRAFAVAHKKDIRGFSAAYLSALAAHGWPGNVRELQNVVERSVVLADGARLGIDDLLPELNRMGWTQDVPRGAFHEALRGFKREIVRSALKRHNGNKLKAAQELHISRCYLHRLLNQLNIKPDTEDGEVEEILTEPVPAARFQ